MAHQLQLLKSSCAVSLWMAYGEVIHALVLALRFSILYILVANQETHGTLGAIMKSRTGNGQVGFLTNRHVAVDLDYPNQKMFQPLPPNHRPGVYLGAVERATSFATDDLWYGIYAGMCPDFDMSTVSTLVKGVGEIGEVKITDLQSPINSIIGKQVIKKSNAGAHNRFWC